MPTVRNWSRWGGINRKRFARNLFILHRNESAMKSTLWRVSKQMLNTEKADFHMCLLPKKSSRVTNELFRKLK